jgi:hypothetical protein
MPEAELQTNSLTKRFFQFRIRLSVCVILKRNSRIQPGLPSLDPDQFGQSIWPENDWYLEIINQKTHDVCAAKRPSYI